MRVSSIIVAVALIGLGPAAAADLDRGGWPDGRSRGASAGGAYGYRYGYGYGYRVRPYVVAPPATVLVVPPDAAPAPLHYAPPPVYPAPPPLIAAVPIVGPYLVPPLFGPPPATVLDTYDHRFDYNQ